MSSIFPQSALNGTGYLRPTPYHLIMREHPLYVSADTAIVPLDFLLLEFDSATSPPLSEAEIADIEEGEREFSKGGGKIYDTAENFIKDLHAARERARKEKTE